MGKRLELTSAPELIFGSVAPIGVDLDLVTEVLGRLLREMGYETTTFRLTSLMQEVPILLPLAEAPYVESVKDRIAYANAVQQAG